MADVVTFESPISPAAFTTFELPPPQQISGKLGSGQAVTLTWTDSSIRPELSKVFAVEARRIANGAPRKNLSGFRDAIAELGGSLVRLKLLEGLELNEVGIVSVVQANAGPGGHLVQSTSIVFFPCDRLRFYGSQEFQSV